MRRAFTLFIVAATVASAARAQQPANPFPLPRLDTVFPCGGQTGQSVTVTLSGADLDGSRELRFSVPGLKAEFVAEDRRGDAANLPARDVLRSPGSQNVTTLSFRVTIPADAPVGSHEVRTVNNRGISNPRAFVVGEQPESTEREPNNDVPEAQRVELNSVVHGVIAASNDVDYFVFAGKKGQRVLAHCQAASVDSKLDPALELYDTAGRRLAFNRRYRDTDALLDATLPTDGDYFLRLYYFTYTQGGPHFFYRLTVTTGPWIDAVFPQAVESGKTSRVKLYGRNLPGGHVEPGMSINGRPAETLNVDVTAPAERDQLTTTGFVPPRMAGTDGFEYRLTSPNGTSNPVRIGLAAAPVVTESEPNDTPESAQMVWPVCEISGRIDRRKDRDWYAFPLKKGEVIILELLGDRAGTACDFYLNLRNATTGQTVEFDDPGASDILHPTQFFNRFADPPAQRFAALTDGTYQVMVGSRESASVAGPDCGYRLRVGPERPDFRLAVMPHQTSTAYPAVLPRDGAQALDVFVWRQDGFTGPIELSTEGLPPGVTCPPQWVGPGMKQAALVLQASFGAEGSVASIKVVSKATIQGREVRHEARPATITWSLPPQSNVPTVARLTRDLVIAVRDPAPFNVVPGFPSNLTVRQGERATISVTLNRINDDFRMPVDVRALSLPQNLIVFNGNQPLAIPAGATEAEATLDVRPQTPPGTYSIVLVGQSQPFPFSRDPVARVKPNVNYRYPAPPITLTVTAR